MAAEHHSQDEVRQTLQALTAEELEQFRRIARYQLYRFAQLDPRDLVQEVAVRFLDMERKWPRDEEFKAVFYNALRSVADEYRGKEMSKLYRVEADLATAADGAPVGLDGIALDGRTPERAAQAKELLTRAFAELKGDQDLEAVLVGRLEGLTAEEVKASFGLSDETYDAARKRFERWLARQEEWKRP